MRSRLSAVAAASMLAALALPLLAVPRAGAADSIALLSWSGLTPKPAPPARLHGALAFDPATGTTVLFGGRAGSQVLADTWTWDGSTWMARNPPASPPPLESASMAYDTVGQRILLFGGISGDGNATNATWSWNGTTWVALAPAVIPPARYAASMAVEPVTGTDLLFGGLSSPGSSLGDTWSWNGANWAPNMPAASPQARSGAAMTFDVTRQVVVLFGGTTGSDNRADTWTWDGSNWAQQGPDASPPARNDAALGFDPATQSVVLFGGSGGNATFGDTWLWNGAAWSMSRALSHVPTLSPPARTGASLAGAPGNQRLVLFGGQSGGSIPNSPNGTVLNDTWTVVTLADSPPSPPPTTGGPAGPTTTAPGGVPTTTTPGRPGSSATTTPTSIPRSPAAPVRAPLAVTSTSRSVHRGDQVTVAGSGFAPGATITITFHSARVVVGTTRADDKGSFTTTVVVPADVPPGPHHIEADGPADQGGRTVLVAQLSIAAPAGHHSWVLPAFMVALTVLLAAAAGVVLTASTRGSRPRPTR